MRYVAYLSASVAATLAGLYAVFHRGGGFVMMMLGLSSVAVMAAIVVVALRPVGQRTGAVVAAVACALPWLLVPIGRVISKRVASDAQGYCAALIDVARNVHTRTGHWPAHGPLDVPGRARPWLLEPGRSVRYPFTFDASDSAFEYGFPDPTGVRTSWHGEATPDGHWVWEHTMD